MTSALIYTSPTRANRSRDAIITHDFQLLPDAKVTIVTDQEARALCAQGDYQRGLAVLARPDQWRNNADILNN